jgi:hypothetical protein
VWRRLFTLCIVLSVLVGSASAGLSIRGRRREDVVAVFVRAGPEGNVLFDMISLHGGVSVVAEYTPHYRWDLVVRDVPNGLGPWVRWSHESKGGVNSDWGGNPSPLHFNYDRDELGRPAWSLFVRCWVLLIACAVFPVAALTRYVAGVVKRSRQGSPRCRVCGYDLRATPGRCPECGTAVVGGG